MTIRAKLYAAIVLTILGPLATTAVALHGMSQMGDRFDEVQARAQHEALARELKFPVTDMNGWQTAYGYAGGPLPGEVRRLGERASATSWTTAKGTLTDAHEQALLEQLQREFDSFMRLDAVAWRQLQAGNGQRTQQILLGPELRRFEAMAATADEPRRLRGAAGRRSRRARFDDARDDARKRLIAVALGAGVVIVLLLVTANDIARWRSRGSAASANAVPAKRLSDGTS